ncbi:MAG: TIGR02281 family clan AA aspartic protease [Sphingomonadales bacterium]|jgi:aspartyl protease family protein|nr:MAG: TIGR02281 family clan AA aspartic protease [Sphingomonadales bacterium]
MIGRALIIWSSTIVIAVNVPSMVGFIDRGGKSQAESPANASVVDASMEDGRYYTLKANEGGHFAGRFRINGKPVDSMIDTGATFVTLSETTARSLGYGGNELNFRYEVSTANGKVKAARINLKSVEIGTVAVRNVDAMVIRGKTLDFPLIGMSFLKKLSGYRAENDELKLLN